MFSLQEMALGPVKFFGDLQPHFLIDELATLAFTVLRARRRCLRLSTG